MLVRLFHVEDEIMDSVVELPVRLDEVRLLIDGIGESLNPRQLIAVSMLEMEQKGLVIHFVCINNDRCGLQFLGHRLPFLSVGQSAGLPPLSFRPITLATEVAKLAA
jgi:hypothetical protein